MNTKPWFPDMLPITTLRTRPLIGSIAVFATLAVSSANAATFLWDANLLTPAAQDGSGIWNPATTNFTSGGANVAWADGNDAAFGAGVDGTYAIDVALNPSATSLIFNNSGYTLSALAPQTITVTNNGANNAITLAAGKTATIGSNVTVTTGTAAANYTVTGAGTLVIDNLGVLRNAASTSSNVLNLNASLVEVRTGGSILTTGPVGANGNAIFINGSLNVTGGLVNSVGTLGLGQSTAIATPAILNITDGTVNATSTNGIRFGAAANATPGGEINLNGGTLRVEKITRGANVNAAVLNFNGGLLQADATTLDFMGGLTAAHIRDGGARIDTNNQNITITQPLLKSELAGDLGTGGLTKGGGGTLFLNAANTYEGATVLNGGALRLGFDKSLGNSTLISTANVQVQIGSSTVGAPLKIDNIIRLVGGGPASDGVLKNLDGVNELTNFGVSGAGGTRIHVAAGTLNLPNSISTDNGGAQNLRVIGTGTLRLGGDNSAVLSGFSFLLGNGTAAGPVIQAGHDLAFGSSTIDFQPLSNSTITSSNATARTFVNNLQFSDAGLNQVTFGAPGTGNLTFNGTANLNGNTEIAVQNASTEISGSVNGFASLTKNGPGTLVLSGIDANNYLGTTTVNSGVLNVKKDGGLGIGDVFVASEATLKLELGTSNNYISDDGRLLLASGSPVVNLDFTGTPDTVAGLSFDGGATFVANGIWGSPTSGAQFTSPAFTGTGTLNVVPEPTIGGVFAAGTMLLGLRRKRVRK
jgi:fibronectin-binding autotransporter adhesin